MTALTDFPTKRNAFTDLIGRHPMVAFVVLVFAIAGIAWPLSYLLDLGVVNGFGVIASASPALAAAIVSALKGPEPSGLPGGKRWRLFGLIGIVLLAAMTVRRLWITPTWLTVAGNVNSTVAYPSSLAFLMDVLAAAVIALLLSGIYSPRQGVRDLLRSLAPGSGPIRWYWWVLALGLAPAMIGLGHAIAAALGMPSPAPQASGPWHLLALDALFTYLVLLFHGGGLEEPGWRGFALPLLQRRFSPVLSSLILAAIWALWHWPVFWFEEAAGGPLGMALYLLLTVAPLALLFTAVFNRTAGSLPVVILLHASINMAPVFLPVSSLDPILWLLLGLGVAVWMWRAPRLFSYRPVASR